MAAERITEKPSFPANYPEDKKAQWHRTFEEAVEAAKVDAPEGSFHHQTARREANRHFRVPLPKSYTDAMKLEPWQVLERKTVPAERVAALGHEPSGSGEHLIVVTIDGKKHFFAVPAAKQADEADEKESDKADKKGVAKK